jgi:hypothetical protein
MRSGPHERDAKHAENGPGGASIEVLNTHLQIASRQYA